MPSKHKYLGLSDEERTLRPTTPTSHVESVSSKNRLIEIAFHPTSHQSDFLQSHSGPSDRKCEPRGLISGRKDPTDLKFWKPYTIRPLFLIFLLLLALAFIGVTETLYYYSQKNDGLWFISDEDALSPRQYFAIQYLPTLLAVLYGILWSLVDLDVKRLEPFYELGKNGGAGVEALFLEYQYQFPLAVPFRSFRKKHWAVFLSSTTFILCTLVAAPLLSSLIVDNPQIINQATTFNISTRFASAKDELAPLSPEFIFSAATVVARNSSFPAFTTAEFSILPFGMDLESRRGLSQETWKARSTAYRLAVDCVSAQLQRAEVGTIFEEDEPVLSGGWGYVYPGTRCYEAGPEPLFFEEDGTKAHTAHWDKPAVAWCGPNNTTTFATFSPLPPKRNLTETNAFFCTTTGVESADIEVEVDAVSKTVKKVLSKPQFERDATAGEIDLYGFNRALFDGYAIENLGSDWAVLTEFPMTHTEFLTAIGGNDLFTNRETFKQNLINTYRLWFSMATGATDVFYLNTTASTIPGVRSIAGTVVTIDRTFATLVDSCFALIVLNSIMLSLYVYQRRSTLLKDPDSISGVLALVADSDLLQAMDGLDRANSLQLKRVLQDRLFDRIQEEGIPRTLRLHYGILFFATLLAIVTFIVALLHISLTPASLPTITDNTFLFGLLWSAVPTLVATSLEPMWASLNRDVSVLQPFYNLTKRNMPASRTISQKYSVIPLILAFRAFSGRDILLGIVSSMTVLTSVLAVTLPGIFDNTIKPVDTTIDVVQPYQARLRTNNTLLNVEGLDMYRLAEKESYLYTTTFVPARANISDHADLPIWTTHNLTLIPIFPTNTSGDFDSMTTETVGFGISLDCREIVNGTSGTFYHNANETTTVYYEINGNVSCSAEFGWRIPSEAIDGSTRPQKYFGRFPRQYVGSSAELYNFIISGDASAPIRTYKRGGLFDDGAQPAMDCGETILTTWSTRYLENKQVSNGTVWTQSAPPDHTMLVCQPQILSQNIRVTVDKLGKIQTVERLGDPITHIGESEIFTSGTGVDFVKQINHLFQRLSWRSWDWPGLLMTRLAAATPQVYMDPDKLKALTQETYALAFSVFVSENRDDLLERNTRDPYPVTASKNMTRVEMSIPLTILSLAILLLFCITLILIYTFRRQRYLPRHPTTLAATIAYFWDSSLLNDIKGTYQMSTAELESHLAQNGDSYGFGWYQGRSGRRCLGVDREPLLEGYNGSNFQRSGKNAI
ncbi:hypothetical protein ABW19_dt0205836 [Dactylella cylindrospora]|nr:hypothetical protein ABW19_dt0205836 [Dactylella cylindrospora]